MSVDVLPNDYTRRVNRFGKRSLPGMFSRPRSVESGDRSVTRPQEAVINIVGVGKLACGRTFLVEGTKQSALPRILAGSRSVEC